MHRAISTAVQRLTAVRDRLARPRPSATAPGRHALPVRVRVPADLRRAGLALAAATVVALAVAVSTGGAASDATIAATTAVDGGASPSAAARQQAADRADRSGRTSPTPTATLSPSATTPSATSPRATTPPPAPTAAPKPAPPPAPDWVSPMPGVPLSSCYGLRGGVPHQGIDFAGDAGTKILSVGAGTVITAGWNYSGYGISVVVDHGNGYLSHYAHASEVLVAVGQTVKPGTPLALEGSTGDSTGPHLHFEIHQGSLWSQIDPAPWLRAHGVAVGC